MNKLIENVFAVSEIKGVGIGSFICFLTGAYLMGSIPFGYLFTKLSGLGDIRMQGSGNIGATNVLRTGNKKIAILTLLCDFFKGYLAVFLLGQIYLKGWYFNDNFLMGGYVFGIFAVLGHIFPLWLGFKGGKGVATALGTFFALNMWLGVITVLLWVITAKIFKISSLAALVAFSFTSIGVNVTNYFFEIKFYNFYYGLYCLFITFVLFLTHKDNIKRLIQGEESAFNRA